jgi:triosephosphate isomerase
MHKIVAQSLDYVQTLRQRCQNLTQTVEIILCVPFTTIQAISTVSDVSWVSVGAQDVHDRDWGAYTGEVSAPMLADVGCKYCMVGHSERRKHFAETDETVNLKTKALHRAGVAPIVCIGETLDEREGGITLKKLERRLVAPGDERDGGSLRTDLGHRYGKNGPARSGRGGTPFHPRDD